MSNSNLPGWANLDSTEKVYYELWQCSVFYNNAKGQYDYLKEKHLGNMYTSERAAYVKNEMAVQAKNIGYPVEVLVKKGE